MANARHESSHPRGRSRHPVPPRDQGDAEGDAAGRRQAGHPVRGRGGRRRRPARRPDGHRPQQERAREPLRPRSPSSRRRSSSKGDTDRLEKVNYSTDSRRHPLRAPGRPEGPRPRGAAARRCTSGTSRSRCCSATTSSTRATRCCSRMLEVQAGAQRHRRGPARGRPRLRSTCTARRPSSRPTRTTWCASRAWSRSRTRRTRPSNYADHRPLRAAPGGLRRAREAPSPARAARSS